MKKFSQSDIEVLSKETVFRGFFKMIKYRFKHRLFAGGWSQIVEREMFERGPAVAMLPYDPIRDEIVLIEQIRVGALEEKTPWQLEIIAGILDEGETLEATARREAYEEAGLTVDKLSFTYAYYPSSGGCNERLHVYIGSIDASEVSSTGGLDSEDEDIRTHVVSRDQAFALLKDGRIENGAAIVALQWLALNREQLLKDWQIAS